MISSLILTISKCTCIFSLLLPGSFSEEEIMLFPFQRQPFHFALVIVFFPIPSLLQFSSSASCTVLSSSLCSCCSTLPSQAFSSNPISLNPNCLEYRQMKYPKMRFPSSHRNSLLSYLYHISLHFVSWLLLSTNCKMQHVLLLH